MARRGERDDVAAAAAAVTTDDLYGDLQDAPESIQEAQIKRELDVQKQYSKILAQRTVELEEKVRELESHNSILERNISCLYVTAKKEIERKDSMLQSLREKLWQRDGVGQTTKNSR